MEQTLRVRPGEACDVLSGGGKVLEDAESVIAAQLNPDEHLFWVGQPRRGLRLQASDAAMIPFSLMWGGFAIFWETTVIVNGAPLFFRLWGIPFVLIGLYMMVGRFWVDAWQRARSYYGVTDRRIIIVTTFVHETIQSIYYLSLGQICLIACKDGSGTITFGVPSLAGTMEFRSRRSKPEPAAFRLIDDVRDVYDMILKLQAAARG